MSFAFTPNTNHIENYVQKCILDKPNLNNNFLSIRIPKEVTAVEHPENYLVAETIHICPETPSPTSSLLEYNP